MSGPSFGVERRSRHLTSAQNASVKKLRALLDAPNKTGIEFAFEGDNLLAEALRSGLKLATVFLTETRLNARDFRFESLDSDIVSLPDSLFRSIVSTETPQGIAAVAARPHYQLDKILDVPNPLFVIAAAIQDPGNLGTLIRSAEAFGATGILALPGTVSAWNQKALRASAGSTFRMPIVEFEINQIRSLQQRGIRVYAAVAGDAVQVRQLQLQDPTAIMIGNEGNGLSPELIRLADDRIAIPFTGSVESLNAAVAGSILLYEAAQMRRGALQ